MLVYVCGCIALLDSTVGLLATYPVLYCLKEGLLELPQNTKRPKHGLCSVRELIFDNIAYAPVKPDVPLAWN